MKRTSSFGGGAWVCVAAFIVIVYGAGFVPVYAWISRPEHAVPDPFVHPTLYLRGQNFQFSFAKRSAIKLYSPFFLLCEEFPRLNEWVRGRGYALNVWW
jgi:hypothetical protein